MNEVLILICMILSLLAAFGIGMIHTGLTRAHATSSVCLMVLGGAGVAALTYYVAGFGMMMFLQGQKIFPLFYFDPAMATGWISGVVMLVIASSIIAGTLTERIRVWPYFAFIGFFSAVIFPLCVGLETWLAAGALGFVDFAGGATVHVAAGAAALAGTRVLGPRAGRYAPDGRAVPFPGSNIPLAALGVMLAWIGFLCLTLALGLAENMPQDRIGAAVTSVFLGGAAGCVATMWFTILRYGKPDLSIVINGTMAGLASMAASPAGLLPLSACIIGAAAGAACAALVPALDRYKIDDVSGVVPSHLAGGIIGILAAGLFGVANPIAQIVGLVAIGASAYLMSYGFWAVLKMTWGIRCPERSERHGLDMGELGMESYPDFSIRTAGRPDIVHIDRY